MSTTFRPSDKVPALWTIVVLIVLGAATDGRTQDLPQVRSESKAEAESWDGVWIGSWGGGMRDGTVFQPAIAELAIRGEHVATHGFPDGNDVRGTFRVDAKTRQLRIKLAKDVKRAAGPAEVVFQYELNGKQLTLTTADKKTISFLKEATTNPPADIQVQLVAGSLTGKGQLVIAEYTRFSTEGIAGEFYRPLERRLNAQQAAIFVSEQDAIKRLSLAEAEKLAAKPAIVAIAFRPQTEERPNPVHERWKDLGPTPADAYAALATLAGSLRPGTLLFVFPHEESVPQP